MDEMFLEVSEMIERACVNSWRSVIGRDDSDAILSVNSVICTREVEDNGDWSFSFGLRVGRRWIQSKKTIPPVRYSMIDPPDIDKCDVEDMMSPDNISSSISMELMMEVANGVKSGQ